MMYQILRRSREKVKYFIVFTFVIVFSLLLTVVFKNDNTTKEKVDEKSAYLPAKELTKVKNFLFSKIQSPFININYEIKSGDTIQVSGSPDYLWSLKEPVKITAERYLCFNSSGHSLEGFAEE